MGDQAVIIAGDHINAVDSNAVDDGLKFEDCAILPVPFADIFEFRIAQRMPRRRQIFGGDRLAQLGRVDNGAFEDTVVVQDRGDGIYIARQGDFVLNFGGVMWH